MPYLSRDDIEKIADSIIRQYKQACVPERHMCYNVDPVELLSNEAREKELVRVACLLQASSGAS